MNRCVRHTAAFCLLLLLALLGNAARVQLVQAARLDADPANRRSDIALYRRPRGDILAGAGAVTGSRATGAS